MLKFPPFQIPFPRDRWTLPHVLEHQAEHRADKPFLSWTDAGKPHSFAETNALVNRLAHGFSAQGVKKGDRVVIFLPNSLEYVFTWFALQKIGAVEVAIGESSKGYFLEHQLRLTQPRIVVTTPALGQRLKEVEGESPSVELCVLWTADDDETPAPSFARIATMAFEELYTDNNLNPSVEVSPRDPAAVLFTSGTTGPSKGVLMSHSQLHFFALEDCQITRLTEMDVYATGFPLFHGNAQFLTVYPCLIVGAHCVLYARFSATDFIGRIRRSGATVVNMLGATMAFVLAQPERDDDRSHNLRCIYGAPAPHEMKKQFEARFGVREWANGFGQTEISMPFLSPPGHPIPPNAVGVLAEEWFEAMLADPETGEPVADGEPGELLLRPKFPYIISSEYIAMPEKTVEAWRNLWFHTGDCLRRDADGWYYFVDRVKDALRRRGENISSFEVESVVQAFPSVAECAVVGVKADEAGGENEVMACVILKEGETLDHAALMAWCDARMPYYMIPRYIEVMADFPRTPSEKIKKNELRDRGVTPSTWDRIASGVKVSAR